MPSCNTYHRTWDFLTLDVGYLFMADSRKAQPLLLTLDEVPPPDLERGVAPLSPPVPTQLLLLGHGVAPLVRHL